MTQAETILVAEDDPDDRLLVEQAIEETGIGYPVSFVEDGEDLMDYLHRRGAFEHLKDSALPALVLLDLNMPRKDGLTALDEIKADPVLQDIPVVVLSTSRSVEDIAQTYAHGASSFFTKSSSFSGLSDIANALSELMD